MSSSNNKFRVAFIHPDLGIGGAERLVVDAALGLQELGHSVDIYTSHHDPNHSFDETNNGTLRVHNIRPPFPRAVKGRFHIVLAHVRQLHLMSYLLCTSSSNYDVYFVDQLSTCVPILRTLAGKRVVFYCHFPDKLLANGAFTEGNLNKKSAPLLKRLYRYPMDWLEEATTTQADVILANSKFTARITKSNFASLSDTPRVVYPGINIGAYELQTDFSDPDILQLSSDIPTLLSLNRFEKKKNVALAIESFALLRHKLSDQHTMRLVIAGGYDPRLEDNINTLANLIANAKTNSLTCNVIAPSTSRMAVPSFDCTPTNPDILFVLNFTTAQRSALLTAPSTLALLYTPTNEHFGIGPVEGMVCGLPILATNTGGPTESVVDHPIDERTGWLCPPDPEVWADALAEVVALTADERRALNARSRTRARDLFGMEAMAKSLEVILEEAVSMGPVPGSALWLWVALVGVLGLLIPFVMGRSINSLP